MVWGIENSGELRTMSLFYAKNNPVVSFSRNGYPSATGHSRGASPLHAPRGS